jgi:hypothetical protein
LEKRLARLVAFFSAFRRILRKVATQIVAAAPCHVNRVLHPSKDMLQGRPTPVIAQMCGTLQAGLSFPWQTTGIMQP